MFDFDAGKLLIIGIVALVVIPPKDLPSVMRQAGQVLGKMRRMASEFQSQFMDAIREAEIDEIRKDVAKLADSAKLDVDFDPVSTVRNEIKGALGEGVAGTGPIGLGSAVGNEQSDGTHLSTDVKSTQAVTQETAAAGVVQLASPQAGESQGGEATLVIPPLLAESVAASPAPQPSEVPASAVQEAGARQT